jgi:hypothetical protein
MKVPLTAIWRSIADGPPWRGAEPASAWRIENALGERPLIFHRKVDDLCPFDCPLRCLLGGGNSRKLPLRDRVGFARRQRKLGEGSARPYGAQLCGWVRCRFVSLTWCAIELWRSYTSAHRRHLSAIRFHTAVFSAECVNLAIRSHSTANLTNFSEGFTGSPSVRPLSDTTKRGSQEGSKKSFKSRRWY